MLTGEDLLDTDDSDVDDVRRPGRAGQGKAKACVAGGIEIEISRFSYKQVPHTILLFD